ncbi:MAG: uroporphyrinogen-III synthase [Ilumatobacteraceae bacterium]
MSPAAESSGPLTGRTVVTTRDEPGLLDRALALAGATVVHVPLIVVVDPPDGGEALDGALADLARFDWLVVTSQHGARRVASAAAGRPAIRLGAVGTKTADVLRSGTGREVDVVPERQTAADLVASMPDTASGARVLVVQADLADAVLADGLRARGYIVQTVVGYSTQLRTPSHDERQQALGADAVAFASGSAAMSWHAAFGSAAPPVVVAIGPTTAAAAAASGLQVDRIAADHSVDGLVDAVIAAFFDRP